MANRFPLIINTAGGNSVQELPAGDFLDLSGNSGITSGTVSNCTVDGTNPVGFLNIPQNSQSADYTLILADAGKHIFHPAADNNARTFTIPANSLL